MSPLFLLHPKNQPFLDGKDRIPASVWPRFWPFLILTTFCLAGTAGVLFYFLRDIQIADYLRAHGTPANAVVLESHVPMDDEGTGRITFRYGTRAKDGDAQRTITCTQNTRSKTAESHPKGSRMDVKYDPANPELVRIVDELKMAPSPEFPGDEDHLGLKLIGGMGAFLVLLSFAAWLRDGLLPTLYIRRNLGQLLPGQVVARKGSTDDMDVYWIHLYFRFQTSTGALLTGWSGAVRRDDLAAKTLPPPGTPIQVYFVDEKHYWCV